MPVPKVSVIMATRNQGDWIYRSLKSVTNQSFKDWELIIVNDGSTDNTEEIIQNFQKKDKRIIYLDNGKNLGVPKSFNRAMALAQGKYIARIDSDDVWIGKDKLKKQYDFLETYPDYAAVSGGMIVIDSEGKELFRYLKPETDEQIRSAALVTNPIANSASVCRKDAIVKAGLCDASLDYNEDWDFWLKIGLLGKLYNFPDYFSYYTMTGRNKSMVYLREHTIAALKIIWKYRQSYPNFLKGFSVNFIQFLYGCVPYKIRFLFNASLSKFKKKIAGSRIKGPEQNQENGIQSDKFSGIVKKTSPLVSILLPTYNRAGFIGKAIESVINQSFKNWELIIIDDYSTDNTEKVVESFQKKGLKIKLVKNKKNFYPDISRILNQGLALAKGKYIARLDDDDWWSHSDKLKMQVEFLENHPDYVVCGSGMIIVDAADRELFRYLKSENDSEIRLNALIVNPFSHTTALFSKSAALKVGGYGNWFYAEDWDLWLKLGRAGKFYNLQKYLTTYRMSGVNKSFLYQKPQTKMIFNIIKKHRSDYPRFYFAFMFNCLQYLYSFLPLVLRKNFHPSLAYWKRSFFSIFE